MIKCWSILKGFLIDRNPLGPAPQGIRILSSIASIADDYFILRFEIKSLPVWDSS